MKISMEVGVKTPQDPKKWSMVPHLLFFFFEDPGFSESMIFFGQAQYGTPWDPGPWGPGTGPLGTPGTLGPWDPGTLGPWDTGTLGHWDPGTLGPWDPGTLGPWDPGTLGPWDPVGGCLG